MKIVIWRILLFSLAVFVFGISAFAQASEKTPVLVELFTSEGCVRCPPAEYNLAFLEKEQPFAGAEIVALALHVDYWNSAAWKDPYSSALFTQRQKIYSRAFKIYDLFTPQMVVDGAEQLFGTDLSKVQKAVVESTKREKAKVELSRNENTLKVKIISIAARENASVFLAVAESRVNRTINRPGAPAEHSSIVRELKPLGSVAAGVQNFEIESSLQLPPEWKPENLKHVIFVQENQSRRVLGTGVLNF